MADTAEQRFRAAFERLKQGKPVRLEKGVEISQNNVAKEAGLHPTALKKDRFPTLVIEIQQEVSARAAVREESKRRRHFQRKPTRDLKQQNADLLAMFSEMANRLLNAEAENLRLVERNEKLQLELDRNVLPIASSRSNKMED